MKPKIRIIDAGYGNAFSVRQALTRAGARIVDENEDGVVMPGVGAFDAGAKNLGDARGAISSGKPFLGICLGMQLLFESSAEGKGRGLAIMEGRVRKLKARTLPHMGWNTVDFQGGVLGNGMEEPWFYFVHSYACPENPWVRGWTQYGQRFASAVEKKNAFGVQFHPEKSGKSGGRLLENFVEVVRQWK